MAIFLVPSTGGGDGGASALDDLTDVVISSAGNGEALVYDSVAGAWVNDFIAGGGGASSTGDNLFLASSFV